MLIIIAFSIMITAIFSYMSWEKKMSPYHIIARFGWFINGFLCVGAIAEIDSVGAIFPLLLTAIICWFILYKMFVQPE